MCRRAPLGVFQFSIALCCFNIKYVQCMQNHYGFIISSFYELHFFVLGELSGFLGSLFPVVLRVFVLSQLNLFFLV